MRAAGKLLEHVAGVVGGARLADDAAFESDDGIGGDHNGGADGAGGDEFGFGGGEALDVVGGRFLGEGSFVDGGRNDEKENAGVVKNFGAAG